MRITEHFSVEEFFCNDVHHTPYPIEWLNSRLLPLCEQLELIRTMFGGLPVVINSGYRTPEFNQAIKGAKNSQHVQGRAADIVVFSVNARQVAAEIRRAIVLKKLSITGLGSYRSFTHIDIRPTNKLVYWYDKK